MPPPSKKRKAGPAPEQITFDSAAREEYLTGFHKRKVARIKRGQEENAKKDREERIRIRADMRKQRKEDLEKHVSEVNRLVKQANGELFSDSSDGEDDEDNGEWNGIPDAPEPEVIDQEEEYIDEDKYTTVTIETVGISKQGFETKGDGSEDEGEGKEKKVWTKEKPKTARPKKKKIKFRYETKAERKAERVKQGVKKKKQRDSRMAKEA
ncbi:hypothetical protein P280DRAFT_389373 [Massarina eburnea CBS 473.64]|uniref:Nucleolar protein 12 n=1 Tax=Massarina eburnea CBS 473.64 TaxID=1395130 RepID=A0A6A6SD21_9PLEO|nr:hypothetical protein P280DRAFT_389373 [Massarina eburnea CBS 473.64]